MGCKDQTMKDKLSVYYRDYRPWELPGLDQKAQTYKFQKTNLNMGDNHHPGRWTSVHDKDYVKHDYVAPSRLNEEKKQDLRTHHFNFGNLLLPFRRLEWSQGQRVKDEFPQKEVDLDFRNGEVLKNKLRNDNFEIGDHSRKMANSVYDTTYVPHPVDRFAAPNREELKKKVVELRNTNLVLGQDKNDVASTMKADYKKISNFQPTILNRAHLQKTHFELGTDQPNMTSINRTYFKAPKPDLSGTLENEKRELIADLRRSVLLIVGHHFDFGQSAADYGTDYAYNYKDHGVNLTQAIDPNLMKNHFTIGEPDAGFEQGSVYMRDMKKFDSDVYRQAAVNSMTGRDKQSNWDFGGFDNNWQSEAQTQYARLD